MDKIFNTIAIIIGIIGGIILNIIGKFDVFLAVLVTLIVIDYVSGIMKAIYSRQLSSYIGWHGLLKKIATLFIVCVANLIQKILGDGIAIRDIVIMFYIANEGLSILENVAAMGNVVPKPLKDILLQLRSKNSGENDKEESEPDEDN